MDEYIDGKEEMIADEAKRERKEDKFDEEMRVFEEEMNQWRKEFAEEVKKYQWEINYQNDIGKANYRGKEKMENLMGLESCRMISSELKHNGRMGLIMEGLLKFSIIIGFSTMS